MNKKILVIILIILMTVLGFVFWTNFKKDESSNNSDYALDYFVYKDKKIFLNNNLKDFSSQFQGIDCKLHYNVTNEIDIDQISSSTSFIVDNDLIHNDSTLGNAQIICPVDNFPLTIYSSNITITYTDIKYKENYLEKKPDSFLATIYDEKIDFYFKNGKNIELNPLDLNIDSIDNAFKNKCKKDNDKIICDFNENFKISADNAGVYFNYYK